MKALKVTVSGSYKTHEHKIVDFSGLEGIIPYVDEDVAHMHIMARYVPMWITASDKYKERYVRRRNLYIDEVEEVEHDFSFVGKSIAKMNYEELQDLATAKDLRSIPLWKTGSLKEAQNRAYAAYSTKVLGVDVDYRVAGFNAAHMPEIIATLEPRRDFEKKITNDEVISQAQTGSHLSLDDLKAIAAQKGISYHPKIGYDALHAKLFAA